MSVRIVVPGKNPLVEYSTVFPDKNASVPHDQVMVYHEPPLKNSPPEGDVIITSVGAVLSKVN